MNAVSCFANIRVVMLSKSVICLWVSAAVFMVHVWFRVSIISAVRPTLSRQMEMGIFNVRTNLGACRTHEGESGTNKSAQELTRRDRKTAPHSVPPRDRTQGLLSSIPTF